MNAIAMRRTFKFERDTLTMMCGDEKDVGLAGDRLSNRVISLDESRRRLVSVPKVRSNRILQPQRSEGALSHFPVKISPFSSELFDLCVVPNKALEPTLAAVMPRAGARVMPAASVAHL